MSDSPIPPIPPSGDSPIDQSPNWRHSVDQTWLAHRVLDDEGSPSYPPRYPGQNGPATKPLP